MSPISNVRSQADQQIIDSHETENDRLVKVIGEKDREVYQLKEKLSQLERAWAKDREANQHQEGTLKQTLQDERQQYEDFKSRVMQVIEENQKLQTVCEENNALITGL